MKRSLSAAAVLGVVIAGCGSSAPSLSSFKSGFAAQKAQFTQLGQQLSQTIANAGGKSDTTLASEFSSLSARDSQVTAQLRKLDPPSQYKARMTQLISGFQVIAGDLSTIASAATRHDGSTVRAAASKLVPDSASVKSIDQSITASLGLPQTP